MTAPLSELVNATTTTEPTELERDVQTALYEARVLYGAVGYFAESIASKCRKHGRVALLTGMGALGAPFAALLGMLAQVWPAMSDAPFPAMPDEAKPVTVEVVE